MSASKIEVVTLRSGGQTARPLVNVVTMALRRLMTEDPIGFYEFVTLCRNPQHKLWGDYEQKFRKLSLIESDGQPHDGTREIVLDSVVGDELQMRLQSPLKTED